MCGTTSVYVSTLTPSVYNAPMSTVFEVTEGLFAAITMDSNWLYIVLKFVLWPLQSGSMKAYDRKQQCGFNSLPSVYQLACDLHHPCFG